MYTNTIIELLLFALCLSLWINALHLAFGEGMILEPFFKWLDKNITNKYIRKPLFACGTCMASIHSLPLLFIFPLWKVFFICIFASVLATLIRDKLFE
jgi:hypothetical protein